MGTYSLTYDFEELPLLGTGTGYVSGKAFVALDPVTTDYFIEQLYLDTIVCGEILPPVGFFCGGPHSAG